MTPLRTERINIVNMSQPEQLISYEGDFNLDLEAYFNDYCDKDNLTFNIISILGCQSSGKSTLINAMFKTDFEVMDSKFGRTQTTKGLWVATDNQNDDKCTLIIDVEGTDSRERGDDRDSFEHKASLFALAMSDMVIVNMWYTDLGRYNASNYGLLRTVLQLNLELFQHQKGTTKTCLLFVIRDYDHRYSPMSALQHMIYSDLQNLWAEIVKPDGLETSLVTDFFAFNFFGLPSIYSEGNAFTEAVKSLRETWFNRWRHPEYIQSIAYGDIYLYAQSLWDTIKSASELDIPSQKRLISRYRCEALKLELLATIESQLSEDEFLSPDNYDQPFLKITEKLTTLATKTLTMYDTQCYRYDVTLFDETRANLCEAMGSAFQNLLNTELELDRKLALQSCFIKLNDTVLQLFDTVDEKSAPPPSILDKLNVELDNWEESISRDFVERYKNIAVPFISVSESLPERKNLITKHAQWKESSRWAYNSEEAVDRILELVTVQRREAYRNVLCLYWNKLSAFCESHWIHKDLTKLLCNAHIKCEQFWKECNQLLIGLEPKLGEHQPFFDKYNAFYHGSKRADVTSGAFLFVTFRSAMAQIASETAKLTDIVLNRFDKIYQDDEHGVPRSWSKLSRDSISDLFVKSRISALRILDDLADNCYLTCHKDDQASVNQLLSNIGVNDAANPLLEPSTKEEVINNADAKMKRSFTESLERNELAAMSSIPWQYWILLLCFGYNELMYVFRSPILIIMIVIIMVIISVAITSGKVGMLQSQAAFIGACLASSLLPILKKMTEYNNKKDE